MSMFFCHRCDTLRDSDDGCKEGPRFSLICAACMDEEPALVRHDRQFSAEQQAFIDKWEAEAEEP
jgi:hypothetical protein